MSNEYELAGKWRPEFRALDYFTQGFIEALFFTAPEDESGNSPSDSDFEGLDPGSLARIVADCERFQADNADALQAYREARAKECEARGWNADASAGGDFLYTRNGHGVGFWDRDLPGDLGERLLKASKAYSEITLYRGDDGRLYI